MGAPSRERLVLLHAWPDGDFFENTRGSQRVKLDLSRCRAVLILFFSSYLCPENLVAKTGQLNHCAAFVRQSLLSSAATKSWKKALNAKYVSWWGCYLSLRRVEMWNRFRWRTWHDSWQVRSWRLPVVAGSGSELYRHDFATKGLVRY